MGHNRREVIGPVIGGRRIEHHIGRCGQGGAGRLCHLIAFAAHGARIVPRTCIGLAGEQFKSGAHAQLNFGTRIVKMQRRLRLFLHVGNFGRAGVGVKPQVSGLRVAAAHGTTVLISGNPSGETVARPGV